MEEQEASGESGVVIEEIVLPPVPEEKAVIDLVALGERLKHYMLIVFNLLQAKYYQWTPVVRAHASAWGGIFYQQISKQYHMFNLKTRSYKYRTFVAITLLVLILFFVFDALFFASRIDPPKAPMAQKLPPPPPQKNTVPEIAKQQLPWNQQDDAKLNKNLIERTPGLGSKGDQKDTFSADPKNPQSVGKLLSRLVSNDVNLLHYFRSILDKHDAGQRPKRVANKSDGEEEAVFDNDEDEADEEELDTLQRGGKRIVPDSTLTSQQLLLKAWSRQQQEQQQKQQLHEQQQQQPHQQQQPQQANPAEGSGGKPKIVDYENPYLLGDLGAAQMNLPHIRNISDHINELAAFTERLNKEKVPGDNPQLVQLVKDYWIRKPSGLPYQLDQPDLPDTSMGQAAVVDEILRQKRNGFFVECGALDGETRSNTLFFERERGWTGLLIEPGPVNYRRMVKKHRRAYISPACLGVEPHPSRKFFHRGKNRGRLLDAEDSVQWVADQFMILDRTGVQCLPLYTMLLALNQTHVDYFSLDVEGVELEVLQSIPFHLLDIDVISVEFAHGRATKEELKEYATNVLGYRVVYEVSRKDWLANDFILVREDLLN